MCQPCQGHETITDPPGCYPVSRFEYCPPVTARLSSSNDLGIVHEAYLASAITKEEYRQIIQSAFQVRFSTNAVE